MIAGRYGARTTNGRVRHDVTIDFLIWCKAERNPDAGPVTNGLIEARQKNRLEEINALSCKRPEIEIFRTRSGAPHRVRRLRWACQSCSFGGLAQSLQ